MNDKSLYVQTSVTFWLWTLIDDSKQSSRKHEDAKVLENCLKKLKLRL